MLGIVLLFGNSCVFFLIFKFCAFSCATLCSELCYFSEILVFFFLVLSFVLFLVLLRARNCATFRKFLCFFLVPRLQFLSMSTSTKKHNCFDCLSPKRKFETFGKLFRKSGAYSVKFVSKLCRQQPSGQFQSKARSEAASDSGLARHCRALEPEAVCTDRQIDKCLT